MQSELALNGGLPVRKYKWPNWPSADNGTEEILLDVLYSDRWALSGRYLGRPSYNEKFSKAFAEYCGVPFCVTTSSGTSALVVALKALSIQHGAEVIVPGNTWVACASSVIQLGAIPVLVDPEPGMLSLSPQTVEDSITRKTTAIIVVHQSCTLADMEGFIKISQETGIPLIEDCSQAHGALFNGKRVGSFGHLAVFSMQDSKVLSSGEGGAIVTSDVELFQKCEQIRSDGRRFARQKRINHLELEEVGAIQGYNYNLSEFQAAILLNRIQYLDQENRKRLDNGLGLNKLLGAVDGVTSYLSVSRKRVPTIYQFAMRIDRNMFNDVPISLIALALSMELGVEVETMDSPLNDSNLLLPFIFFQSTNNKIQRVKYEPSSYSLPNTAEMADQILLVPHFIFLGNASDVADIVKAINKVRDLSYSIQF